MEAIASGAHGTVPYLLLGPAGTGKTRTLMAAVMRVLAAGVAAGRHDRLLLVAPSDSAADLLLKELHSRAQVWRQWGLVPAFAPSVVPAPVAAAAAAAAAAPVGGDDMEPDATASLALPPERAGGGGAVGSAPGSRAVVMPPLPATAPRTILRVVAATRKVEALAAMELQRYCAIEAGVDMFRLPRLDEVAAARVVVAAMPALGALLAHAPAGAPTPSHIFIDEASQAIEPEVALALAAAGPDTHLILAGDPRQLGPSMHSALAATRGLRVSLQERLLGPSSYDPRAADHDGAAPTRITLEAVARDALVDAGATGGSGASAAATRPSLYAAHQAAVLASGGGGGSSEAARYSTTLTVNYRAHPALLLLSSTLFYGGTLIPGAPASITSALPSWAPLAGGTFPLLAVGVEGADAHVGDSTSYWNDAEVAAVVALVQHLLAEAGVVDAPRDMPAMSLVNARGDAVLLAPPRTGLPPAALRISDVAVVAPYRAQVVRLRSALRDVGLGSVSVGTVDNYQGGERQVVVVSTVLSTRYRAWTARSALVAAARAARVSSGVSGAGAAAPATATAPPAGLLHNPRAFNVATSRAQSLLVCVGDPAVWATDPCWRALLQYAADHDAYAGWSGLPSPCPPSAATLWTPPTGGGDALSSPAPASASATTAPAPAAIGLGFDSVLAATLATAPPAAVASDVGAHHEAHGEDRWNLLM